MINFVVHDEGDSVGVVVVEGVEAGAELTGWIMDQDKDIAFRAASDIPIGHKLAIKPMKAGDTVIKYGVDIGRVVADIAVGETRPRSQHQNQALVGGDIMAMDLANATFRGYRRENGRVGVRNHVIILPVDDLSNAACEAVANNIKGVMAIPHPYGRLQFGADLELHFRTLIGTGANPNVAAVVVIGIEEGWTQRVVDGIAETGKTGHRLRHRVARRPRDDHAGVEDCARIRSAGVRGRARGSATGRPLDINQMRRVRHDLGLRVQSHRRQCLRQALSARRHDGFRRDHGDHRR